MFSIISTGQNDGILRVSSALNAGDCENMHANVRPPFAFEIDTSPSFHLKSWPMGRQRRNNGNVSFRMDAETPDYRYYAMRIRNGTNQPPCDGNNSIPQLTQKRFKTVLNVWANVDKKKFKKCFPYSRSILYPVSRHTSLKRYGKNIFINHFQKATEI